MMKRRAFLAGVVALLAAPFMALGEQTAKVPHVGFLTAFSATDIPLWREGFRQGLRDLGYREGQNIVIEYRYADGHPDRLPALASELVSLKMDVIAVETTPASLALKQATGTIPIVMTIVADPTKSGLVASLARPEGNITGMSLQLPDLSAKRLQLLREIIPTLTRVGVLWNSTSPITSPQFGATEAAARSLGIQLEKLPVEGPDDFNKAFQTAARSRTGAVLLLDDFLLTRRITQLATLALKSRLPTMTGISGFAEAGGLATYGPNFPAVSRRAAIYVDRILKGSKPGDLPIEQPSNFELVVNLKTAKAIGLTVPSSLLLRADKVIQ
jgi:putative tryptophan/tyrosine transport system substrate-binding protein